MDKNLITVVYNSADLDYLGTQYQYDTSRQIHSIKKRYIPMYFCKICTAGLHRMFVQVEELISKKCISRYLYIFSLVVSEPEMIDQKLPESTNILQQIQGPPVLRNPSLRAQLVFIALFRASSVQFNYTKCDGIECRNITKQLNLSRFLHSFSNVQSSLIYKLISKITQLFRVEHSFTSKLFSSNDY